MNIHTTATSTGGILESHLTALGRQGLPCTFHSPDHASFMLKTKHVNVKYDGDSCLSFFLNTNFSGRLQLRRYVRTYCRHPEPYKVILKDGKPFLLLELWTGESCQTEAVLEHAIHVVSHMTGQGGGASARDSASLPTDTHDSIQQILEQLPYQFRLSESGWTGGYDTSHFFNRIMAAAYAAQGVGMVRFEISDDPLSGDDTRVLDALARLFLEANAKTRFVRYGLTPTRGGKLVPVMESVIPLSLLTENSARAHLAALSVGAARVRAEVKALADPSVAEAYLRFTEPALRLPTGAACHD
ncbi:MAG TPA: hypothetical protein PKO23_03070 [Candidatus Hydrogenedentes bacterium]|nr:hypothetical protein [Candidatus Hydrogenedentota bacterium]